MFDAAKRAEPLPVLDDAFSQTLSDSGKLLEFANGRRVDIDTLRVCLIRRSQGLGRIRLLIVRLWTNRLR